MDTMGVAPLQGAVMVNAFFPRALPWAMLCGPFRAVGRQATSSTRILHDQQKNCAMVRPYNQWIGQDCLPHGVGRLSQPGLGRHSGEAPGNLTNQLPAACRVAIRSLVSDLFPVQHSLEQIHFDTHHRHLRAGGKSSAISCGGFLDPYHFRFGDPTFLALLFCLVILRHFPSVTPPTGRRLGCVTQAAGGWPARSLGF